MKHILLFCGMLNCLFAPPTVSNHVATRTENEVPAAQVLSRHRIRTSRPITRLYFDTQAHRLLAQLGDDDTGPIIFAWVKGNYLQKLITVEGYILEIMGIDFERQLIFSTSARLTGTGGYLRGKPFTQNPHRRKDLDEVDTDGSEHLWLMVSGKLDGRNYRCYFPMNTDLEEPKAWVGVYHGNQLLKRIDIGYVANQLLYVPATDEVYCVYAEKLLTLSGKTMPLSDPAESFIGMKNPFSWQYPPSLIVADASGKSAYCISKNQVCKFSLDTGEVLAKRRLSFQPESLAVDGVQKAIYLLDATGKTILKIKQF